MPAASPAHAAALWGMTSVVHSCSSIAVELLAAATAVAEALPVASNAVVLTEPVPAAAVGVAAEAAPAVLESEPAWLVTEPIPNLEDTAWTVVGWGRAKSCCPALGRVLRGLKAAGWAALVEG